MQSAASLVIVLSIFFLAGCFQETKSEQKGKKPRPAIPVSTALSASRTIPVELEATGHVEAANTVEIRSQITGILQKVHFSEGQDLRAGGLLFSIDPRPYAAELAKAEALLTKDRADLENARRDLARYLPAAARGLVSREQADQAQTLVATLSASIKADLAAIEGARLNLGFCSIRAPFSGRAGELLSDQGNLIKANADTPMVTIKSLNPILVTFTLPGRHLQEIMTSQQQHPLETLVRVATNQDPIEGRLVFIDNAVDPTTGVIKLKSEFANSDLRLWPGQLVDIRLHLTDKSDVLVVPSQAVQMGQQGPYVFVVDADHKAEYRLVTAEMRYHGYTVIGQGLKGGEKVVTDGQMLLENGTKIVERNDKTGKKASGQP
nr:efflux RND transporter periplasmic adaptor subunit [uncultured Desulfobulbus sp.]